MRPTPLGGLGTGPAGDLILSARSGYREPSVSHDSGSVLSGCRGTTCSHPSNSRLPATVWSSVRNRRGLVEVAGTADVVADPTGGVACGLHVEHRVLAALQHPGRVEAALHGHGQNRFAVRAAHVKAAQDTGRCRRCSSRFRSGRRRSYSSSAVYRSLLLGLLALGVGAAGERRVELVQSPEPLLHRPPRGQYPKPRLGIVLRNCHGGEFFHELVHAHTPFAGRSPSAARGYRRVGGWSASTCHSSIIDAPGVTICNSGKWSLECSKSRLLNVTMASAPPATASLTTWLSASLTEETAKDFSIRRSFGVERAGHVG